MASEVGQEAARPGRAGKGLRREGGNESIAICASHCSGGGRPPACPAPPRPAGLPELHAQGLAGTSGREQGALSRRAGRFQNHGSHHAVSTVGTGRGQWVGTGPPWPGCEEGMGPTSDGELRQLQLQKRGGEVPVRKLVKSVPSRHSAVPRHPARLYRTLCIY